MVIAPVASFLMSSILRQMGGGGTASIPGLIAQASPFSKTVLLLLVGMSVYSWAVLWDRLRLYARVRTQDNSDLERLIMDLQRDGLVQRTRSQVVMSRLVSRGGDLRASLDPARQRP